MVWGKETLNKGNRKARGAMHKSNTRKMMTFQRILIGGSTFQPHQQFYGLWQYEHLPYNIK
jgi:hypothetical protein